jgi:hypothetical protein
MAETQGAASFNPDDASGLVDNVRAIVKSVVVDFFSADSGFKGVNANFTYAPAGAPEFTERYMIGSAEEWAPNSTKTGVLPVAPGKKIWNKSEIFRLITSFVNAGFPKANVGGDLSVFVGTDVQLNRIADGTVYKDKKTGADRARTTMLVTKVHALPAAGAAGKGKAAAKSAPTSAAATPPAGATDDASNDGVLTEILVEILTEAGKPVTREQLAQPVFIKATKRKLAAVRPALQARIVSDAFLADLATQGLVTLDGANVSMAA